MSAINIKWQEIEPSKPVKDEDMSAVTIILSVSLVTYLPLFVVLVG